MDILAGLKSSLSAAAAILVAMAILALFETLIPLHARGKWHRSHLAPNLALTFLTFATNALYNTGLVLLLAWLAERDLGLLRLLPLHPLAAAALAVVLLDLSAYVAHVAMHKAPALWRVHRVHHADPVVDVTTAVRQHPLEGVIRYAFLTAFAGTLGVGLVPFAVYRVWSAINALLEHANIRVPQWLDTTLALVTTWPNMHKVHHSRHVRETDTNYGNIFSWFDRLFGTYTPSWRGTDIDYGLEGYDHPAQQTTSALLALPFAASPPPRRVNPRRSDSVHRP